MIVVHFGAFWHHLSWPTASGKNFRKAKSYFRPSIFYWGRRNCSPSSTGSTLLSYMQHIMKWNDWEAAERYLPRCIEFNHPQLITLHNLRVEVRLSELYYIVWWTVQPRTVCHQAQKNTWKTTNITAYTAYERQRQNLYKDIISYLFLFCLMCLHNLALWLHSRHGK